MSAGDGQLQEVWNGHLEEKGGKEEEEQDSM